MLKATTVAASAASAAGIVGPTAPGPFSSYLCQPTLADASGQAWKFDLSSIASTQNLAKGGYPFYFAGCGISNFTCSSDSVWNLAGKLTATCESQPDTNIETLQLEYKMREMAPVRSYLPHSLFLCSVCCPPVTPAQVYR